jgi:hypothetical protein
MVRHEEAHTERPGHLDFVAHVEVAEIVADDPARRAALVILQHPLHGQRHVVVAGPLAIARACDRILPWMMRSSVCVDAGREYADRLALKHRKRHRAEIEYDVMGVVVFACFGDPNIADHGGGDRSRRRLRSIEVGVRTRGRPRRDHGCIGFDFERRFLARSIERGLRGSRRGKGRLVRRVRASKFVKAQFRRQSIPAELRLNAVSLSARHLPPVVNASRGAGRNTSHAEIADVRVDDIVARVMRDRADRARRLAGVATDADFGVDQMLPDHLGLGRLHHTLILAASLRAKQSRDHRAPGASSLRSSR